jgi:hypothetical protein
MSKNPNYTGLQTFTIPVDIESLIQGNFSKPKIFTGVKNFSPRQTLANSANVIPDLMRPKPENMVLDNNFYPSYNPPATTNFPLHTATKRRSQDKEMR